MVEGLPSIGNEFGYNPVVFVSAGVGAVFAEVIHFASDADIGSAGGAMVAVFWELFSCVGHSVCLEKVCQLRFLSRFFLACKQRKNVLTRYGTTGYVEPILKWL